MYQKMIGSLKEYVRDIVTTIGGLKSVDYGKKVYIAKAKIYKIQSL